MGCGVYGFAHGRKAAGDACGSFSLDDEDSLDSMVLVSTQALLNRISRHTRAVLDFQPLHVDAMGGGGAAK
jgi:hypothetical protein